MTRFQRCSECCSITTYPVTMPTSVYTCPASHLRERIQAFIAYHSRSLLEHHRRSYHQGSGPTAMKSKLGYVLSGPLPYSTETTTSALHIAALQTNEYDLHRFWVIETSGTSPSCTTDNKFIQSYIDSCISRNNDGSYTARFLWKEYHLPLPSNRSICEKRTRSLINKWCKLLNWYKFMTTS